MLTVRGVKLEYFKKDFFYAPVETDRLLLWEISSVAVAKYGAGMHSANAQWKCTAEQPGQQRASILSCFRHSLYAFLSVLFFSEHGLYVCEGRIDTVFKTQLWNDDSVFLVLKHFKFPNDCHSEVVGSITAFKVRFKHGFPDFMHIYNSFKMNNFV